MVVIVYRVTTRRVTKIVVRIVGNFEVVVDFSIATIIVDGGMGYSITISTVETKSRVVAGSGRLVTSSYEKVVRIMAPDNAGEGDPATTNRRIIIYRKANIDDEGNAILDISIIATTMGDLESFSSMVVTANVNAKSKENDDAIVDNDRVDKVVLAVELIRKVTGQRLVNDVVIHRVESDFVINGRIQDVFLVDSSDLLRLMKLEGSIALTNQKIFLIYQ